MKIVVGITQTSVISPSHCAVISLSIQRKWDVEPVNREVCFSFGLYPARPCRTDHPGTARPDRACPRRSPSTDRIARQNMQTKVLFDFLKVILKLPYKSYEHFLSKPHLAEL